MKEIQYVKGNPYFTDAAEQKNPQKPYSEQSTGCEVLIVGCGISGAITAYYFARAGIDTVVIFATYSNHQGQLIAS